MEVRKSDFLFYLTTNYDLNMSVLHLTFIVRVHQTMLTIINPIRSGGGGAFKVCPHAFNIEAILLCLGDFPKKYFLHRVMKENFD